MIFLFILSFFSFVSAQNNNCSLGRESGDSSCASAGGQRFYFDSRTSRCQPFYYKGCNGNGNNFKTRDECMGRCTGIVSVATSDGGHGGGHKALCPAGNVAANDRGGPIPCSKCPHGYECQNGLCCGTREYTCSLDYDAGRFPLIGSHVPMYFFNRQYGNCMLFTYYGSEGNPNTFPDFNKCRTFCAGR